MLDAMIQAENVGVEFVRPGQDPVPAIDDLTLRVHEGELVAVIGSSGAGKTTLLRCLTGFVRPTCGQLIVDGMDMVGCRSHDLRMLRRRVATIYQHFNLVERATALDNVLHGRLGYAGMLYGLIGLFSQTDRRIAYQALIKLGLGDRAIQRVDQLSGGERQRVTIARALVQQPVMVLADEPAASLDLALTRQIIALLHQLNREYGLTVLVNLHDLDLARSFATRIVGLRNGAIVFDGPPSDLTGEQVEAIYSGPAAQRGPRPFHAVA